MIHWLIWKAIELGGLGLVYKIGVWRERFRKTGQSVSRFFK